MREFDTADGKFVEGGFVLPEAKHSVEWADRDTLLIGTRLGPRDALPNRAIRTSSSAGNAVSRLPPPPRSSAGRHAM